MLVLPQKALKEVISFQMPPQAAHCLQVWLSSPALDSQLVNTTRDSKCLQMVSLPAPNYSSPCHKMTNLWTPGCASHSHMMVSLPVSWASQHLDTATLPKSSSVTYCLKKDWLANTKLKRRHHVPLKHQYPPNWPHATTTQKTITENSVPKTKHCDAVRAQTTHPMLR